MDKPFWKSKKWITGIIGVLIPIANKVFGWNLDEAEVLTVLLPLLAYIIGQGFADAGK